mmetsp:Transcript_11910/g.27594  ORF Transcript_11910/g.27594 Transcript_11910/m.27594 type:complete len:155 (-) Transcript_11910:51-515(-)
MSATCKYIIAVAVLLYLHVAASFVPSRFGRASLGSRGKGTKRSMYPAYPSQDMTTTVYRNEQLSDHSASTTGFSRLSPSVLAKCDTLPSFATAHGMLSPEIVMRMDETTAGGDRNEALSKFFDTYRRQGPLACVQFLSDPTILPHLTSAMRNLG